ALLAGAGLAPARVDLAPLPAWNLLPAVRDDQALVIADGAASALALRRGGRLAGLRALGGSAREPAALASEVRWSLAALGGAPAWRSAGRSRPATALSSGPRRSPLWRSPSAHSTSGSRTIAWRAATRRSSARSRPRLPPRSPARAWSPRRRSSRRRWPPPRGARRGPGARAARWTCRASRRRAGRRRR